MLRGWLSVDVGIVLILLVANSLGRPQNNTTALADESEEYANRTKSRILTHPTKGEFYGSEQNIVFPDAIADRADVPLRISEAPKCSSGLTFCENVDTYPYVHIKRVLQENRILKSLFGQDEGPAEIANRLGDEDEKFVCRSIKQTIFPKMGETKNNKWKFIINQGKDDGFVQGIQVEICKNPEGECDIPGSPSIDSRFTMTCKQKYVYRRLFTVDHNGEPSTDSFKMPSACCCAYKENFDFLSRFGKLLTTTPREGGGGSGGAGES